MVQMKTEQELRKSLRSTTIAYWCYLVMTVFIMIVFFVTMSTKVLILGIVGMWLTAMIQNTLMTEIVRLEVRAK